MYTGFITVFTPAGQIDFKSLDEAMQYLASLEMDSVLSATAVYPRESYLFPREPDTYTHAYDVIRHIERHRNEIEAELWFYQNGLESELYDDSDNILSFIDHDEYGARRVVLEHLDGWRDSYHDKVVELICSHT